MKVIDIPCSRVLVNPENNVSREPFSPESCSGLAATIETHGLLTPVLVRPIEGNENYDYELLVGFRRFTAVAVNLGYQTVAANVVDATPVEGRIFNMIENLQRKDMTYWEECVGMRESFRPETKNPEIALRLGKSRTWARARWLVWDLPDDVIAQVEAGLLGPADISVIISQSPEDQVSAASKLVAGKAAGDTIDNMQRSMTNRGSRRPKKEIKRIITQCTELDTHEGRVAVHALRYATAEISDTLLFELLDKAGKE